MSQKSKLFNKTTGFTSISTIYKSSNAWSKISLSKLQLMNFSSEKHAPVGVQLVLTVFKMHQRIQLK